MFCASKKITNPAADTRQVPSETVLLQSAARCNLSIHCVLSMCRQYQIYSQEISTSFSNSCDVYYAELRTPLNSCTVFCCLKTQCQKYCAQLRNLLSWATDNPYATRHSSISQRFSAKFWAGIVIGYVVGPVSYSLGYIEWNGSASSEFEISSRKRLWYSERLIWEIAKYH
jgi:hypothetical protein